MAKKAEEKQRLLKASNYEQGDYAPYDSCDEITDPLLPASVNVTDDDISPVRQPITDVPVYKVYRRRWYILFLYSMFGFTQSAVWNTWGPISSTAEHAFGWSFSTILWLSNWGCVSIVVGGLLFPWLLHTRGLRVATLISMLCLAVGATLRVITSEPFPATILVHIGQMLNGLAGPIAMCAIPQLSAMWFPPKERVTATVITNSINSLGIAASYVLGPAFVSKDFPEDENNTTDNNTYFDTFSYHAPINSHNNSTDARIQEERAAIMRYMYYSCGWCWLLFLALLIYFPARPRLPPCMSAATRREPYWAGVWSLRKKGSFLSISFMYSVSVGVLTCWGSVLNDILGIIHIHETEAGWIGFYSTVGGCIAPLFIMRFADLFARRMKFFILVLYVLGTACFVVFNLMFIDVVPYSKIGIYSTVIGGTTLINAAVPMMFEVACELAYPTSEGTANGLLIFMNNFIGFVYLGVVAIPHVGKLWMNWGLIGSTAVCIPLIAVLQGRFNRLEVDEGVHPELVVEQEILVAAEDEDEGDEDEAASTFQDIESSKEMDSPRKV